MAYSIAHGIRVLAETSTVSRSCYPENVHCVVVPAGFVFFKPVSFLCLAPGKCLKMSRFYCFILVLLLFFCMCPLRTDADISPAYMLCRGAHAVMVFFIFGTVIAAFAGETVLIFLK